MAEYSELNPLENIFAFPIAVKTKLPTGKDYSSYKDHELIIHTCIKNEQLRCLDTNQQEYVYIPVNYPYPVSYTPVFNEQVFHRVLDLETERKTSAAITWVVTTKSFTYRETVFNVGQVLEIKRNILSRLNLNKMCFSIYPSMRLCNLPLDIVGEFKRCGSPFDCIQRNISEILSSSTLPFLLKLTHQGTDALLLARNLTYLDTVIASHTKKSNELLIFPSTLAIGLDIIKNVDLKKVNQADIESIQKRCVFNYVCFGEPFLNKYSFEKLGIKQRQSIQLDRHGYIVPDAEERGSYEGINLLPDDEINERSDAVGDADDYDSYEDPDKDLGKRPNISKVRPKISRKPLPALPDPNRKSPIPHVPFPPAVEKDDNIEYASDYDTDEECNRRFSEIRQEKEKQEIVTKKDDDDSKMIYENKPRLILHNETISKSKPPPPVAPRKDKKQKEPVKLSTTKDISKDIKEYTVKEVLNLLKETHLGHHVDIFKKNEIDGSLLVQYTEQDFVDMAFSKFESRKFHHYMQGLLFDGVVKFTGDNHVIDKTDLVTSMSFKELNDFIKSCHQEKLASFLLKHEVDGKLFKELVKDDLLLSLEEDYGIPVIRHELMRLKRILQH